MDTKTWTTMVQHVEKECDAIYTCLSMPHTSEENQWTERMRLLKKVPGISLQLQAILETQKKLRQEFNCEELKAQLANLQKHVKRLGMSLANQVSELRSKIVKEACDIVPTLASNLPGHFVDWCAGDVIINALVKNTAKTTNIIFASSFDALKQITATAIIPSRILATMIDPVTDPKAAIAIRTCITELMMIILESQSESEITKIIHLFSKALSMALVDAKDSVRANARRCFFFFETMYPKQAQTIVDSLDSAVQKLISVERSLFYSRSTKPRVSSARLPNQEEPPQTPRRSAMRSSVPVLDSGVGLGLQIPATPSFKHAAPSRVLSNHSIGLSSFPKLSASIAQPPTAGGLRTPPDSAKKEKGLVQDSMYAPETPFMSAQRASTRKATRVEIDQDAASKSKYSLSVIKDMGKKSSRHSRSSFANSAELQAIRNALASGPQRTASMDVKRSLTSSLLINPISNPLAVPTSMHRSTHHDIARISRRSVTSSASSKADSVISMDMPLETPPLSVKDGPVVDIHQSHIDMIDGIRKSMASSKTGKDSNMVQLACARMESAIQGMDPIKGRNSNTKLPLAILRLLQILLASNGSPKHKLDLQKHFYNIPMITLWFVWYKDSKETQAAADVIQSLVATVQKLFRDMFSHEQLAQLYLRAVEFSLNYELDGFSDSLVILEYRRSSLRALNETLRQAQSVGFEIRVTFLRTFVNSVGYIMHESNQRGHRELYDLAKICVSSLVLITPLAALELVCRTMESEYAKEVTIVLQGQDLSQESPNAKEFSVDQPVFATPPAGSALPPSPLWAKTQEILANERTPSGMDNCPDSSQDRPRLGLESSVSKLPQSPLSRSNTPCTPPSLSFLLKEDEGEDRTTVFNRTHEKQPNLSAFMSKSATKEQVHACLLRDDLLARQKPYLFPEDVEVMRKEADEHVELPSSRHPEISLSPQSRHPTETPTESPTNMPGLIVGQHEIRERSKQLSPIPLPPCENVEYSIRSPESNQSPANDSKLGAELDIPEMDASNENLPISHSSESEQSLLGEADIQSVKLADNERVDSTSELFLSLEDDTPAILRQIQHARRQLKIMDLESLEVGPMLFQALEQTLRIVRSSEDDVLCLSLVYSMDLMSALHAMDCTNLSICGDHLGTLMDKTLQIGCLSSNLASEAFLQLIRLAYKTKSDMFCLNWLAEQTRVGPGPQLMGDFAKLRTILSGLGHVFQLAPESIPRRETKEESWRMVCQFVPLLSSCLEHQNYEIRYYAAQALRNMTDFLDLMPDHESGTSAKSVDHPLVASQLSTSQLEYVRYLFSHKENRNTLVDSTFQAV